VRAGASGFLFVDRATDPALSDDEEGVSAGQRPQPFAVSEGQCLAYMAARFGVLIENVNVVDEFGPLRHPYRLGSTLPLC
jgi:hypothetical protein